MPTFLKCFRALPEYSLGNPEVCRLLRVSDCILTHTELKKAPVVIGHLIWQPFHVRFDNILQRLEKHREILQLEMDTVHIKVALEATAQQRKDADQSDRIENKLKGYNTLISQMTRQVTETERREWARTR
jgi:hypothetical protein